MANYKTVQKQTILDMLKENKNRHLNADEMLEILHKRQENVSRATLYRTLDSLVQGEVVRKYVISENEKACFQLINDDSNCHNHFHLVCSKCGKLIHLECDKLEELISHISDEHDFTVLPSRVVLYGICKKCKEGVKANG